MIDFETWRQRVLGSYLEAGVVIGKALSSGSTRYTTMFSQRTSAVCRPQEFCFSTGPCRSSAWQVAARRPHVRSPWDLVAHSQALFMHVAIHRAAAVMCRP